MNNKGIAFFVAASCLMWAQPAQSQTAQIPGRVVNRAGKGIAGASIRLVSSVDDHIGRTPTVGLSDADGHFRVTFDWADIDNGTQKGGVWEVSAEKTDYVTGRASVQLVRGRAPTALQIELLPKDDRDRLTNKVDACANPSSDARTVYLFDFANDSQTPQKLMKFQELLLHKLRTGVRTKLEAAGLLKGSSFEIKGCREAPVKDESDALFAGERLGCPGVIYGFVEEKTNQFKSVVSFTVPSKPSFTDYAPDESSSDLFSVIQPSQDVSGPYLAFSSFVLGRLYLDAGRTDLAIKCFNYAKSSFPGSQLAQRSDLMLEQVQQSSPAVKLAPVGGTSP